MQPAGCVEGGVEFGRRDKLLWPGCCPHQLSNAVDRLLDLRRLISAGNLREQTGQTRSGCRRQAVAGWIEPVVNDHRRSTGRQRREGCQAAPAIRAVPCEQSLEHRQPQLGWKQSRDDRQPIADLDRWLSRRKAGQPADDFIGQRANRRQRLNQPDTGFPDQRIRRLKGQQHVGCRKPVEAGQHKTGEQSAAAADGRITQKLSRQRKRCFVPPRQQQSKGRIAMPAVGMIEQADQFGGGRGTERYHPRTGTACRRQPPEPAGLSAAGQIEMLFDRRRQAGRMLDELPLHVDDPEAAIGSIGKLHRPKPDVP